MEKCKKCLSNLKQTTLDKNKTALLEAAVQLRDKHEEQALSHLEVSTAVEGEVLSSFLCSRNL